MFEYTNQLQTVSNIGKIVLSVIAAVLAVGGAVLFAIIYTMGSKYGVDTHTTTKSSGD